MVLLKLIHRLLRKLSSLRAKFRPGHAKAVEYILTGERENPEPGVIWELETLYRGKSREELEKAIEKFKDKYKLELAEISFSEIKVYELPEKKLKHRISLEYHPGFITKRIKSS